MNKLSLFAASILVAAAPSLSFAGAIDLNFSAGSASGQDNANYFAGSGGAYTTVDNVSLNLTWDTSKLTGCTSHSAGEFACTADSSGTAMSATFAGSYSSTPYSFTVNSDASDTQRTHSPYGVFGGDILEIQQSGSGSLIQWYVVGQNILEAGQLHSSLAFDVSQTPVDQAYINSFIAGLTGMDWFVSTQWVPGDNTYYGNGGDYFSLGGAQFVDASAPEPGTWLSLAGGLAGLGFMKLRRRA